MGFLLEMIATLWIAVVIQMWPVKHRDHYPLRIAAVILAGSILLVFGGMFLPDHTLVRAGMHFLLCVLGVISVRNCRRETWCTVRPGR